MLTSAAFGDQPGFSPLPPAQEPFERWLRAVALAGQGQYTEATAHAAELQGPGRPLAARSMALSLRASILRQQGQHARALDLDSRALALLPPAGHGNEHPAQALARCDALTGCAADNIGLGRLSSSYQALDQASAFVEQAESAAFGWRARLRCRWVGAETAMAAGDTGRALAAALNGHDLAQQCPSLRHRVKSLLVLAAATTLAEGSGQQGQAQAGEAFALANAAGLLPLAWAAAMLLHAVEPGRDWAGRAAGLRAQWR